MDTATLAALLGSIEKWKAIVNGSGADRGTANCPLCAMFRHQLKICAGCPVLGRTGYTCCTGTPYAVFELENKVASAWEHVPGWADTPLLKQIAQKELAFLRSLLPEEGLT